MKDLTKLNRDYAVFLPALSSHVTKQLSLHDKDHEVYLKSLESGAPVSELPETNYPLSRMPDGFENRHKGLNFLDKELGYFFYDKCLYSAGHASLDLNKCDDIETMIHKRDRESTLLVGDSGGYQLGTGAIKFDWDNFYEKEGDDNYVGDADKMRIKILRWLEHTSEWSMCLDVPSRAYDLDHRDRTGMHSFDDCLQATIFNNDFFVKHRVPGATKILNVLQGGDWQEAELWYDAVKHYDFEGWAFGGNNVSDMRMTLKRIITLRDDGLLEGKDWIHVLGSGRLDIACYMTAIQRQIRKHINPNLTISFDCASPYLSAANAMTYGTSTLKPERWSFNLTRFPDCKSLKESDLPFPYTGEIANRLVMGDVSIYGNACAVVNGERDETVTEEEVKQLIEAGIDAHWAPADVNKMGNIGKTSWDTFTYTIIMSHNLYQHIRSVQLANQLNDTEMVTANPIMHDWKKLKRSDRSGELSKTVPRNILYFNKFVEELFVHDDPFAFIEQYDSFLKEVSFRYKKTSTTQFNSLFDVEEVNSEDADKDAFDKFESGNLED